MKLFSYFNPYKILCCSISCVEYDAIRRKYSVNIDDINDDDDDQLVTNKKIEIIKVKPHNDNYIQQHNLKIEDELSLFLMDLKFSIHLNDKFIDVNSYNLISPLQYYTYIELVRHATVSKLLYILKNTLFTFMKLGTNDINVEDHVVSYVQYIINLNSSCKIWTNLLNEYIQNYQGIIDSPHMISPGNHNGYGFTSIEQALMISDILLLSIIHNIIPLYEEKQIEIASIQDTFGYEIINVLRATLGLMTIEDLVVTPQIKVLLSQIVCKYSYLLLQLGKVVINQFQIHTITDTKLSIILGHMQNIVSITQITSNSIQSLTSLCGDTFIGYYYSKLLYWFACSKLLDFFKYISGQILTLLTCEMYKNKTSSNSANSIFFQAHSQVWSLQKRIFSYLQSTAPSSQDISYEIHRLETYKQNLYTSQEDLSLMQLLSNAPTISGINKGRNNSDVHSNTPTVVTSTYYNTSLSTSVNGGDIYTMTNQVAVTQKDIILNGISFRLRFLLIGMQSLFKANDIMINKSSLIINKKDILPSNDILKVSFPNKDKWLVSLIEIILNIFTRLHKEGIILNQINNNTNSNMNNNMNNTSTSTTSVGDMLLLCPYLARQLLNLIVQNTSSSAIRHANNLKNNQNNHNLIYLDLGKSLSDFTQAMRKRYVILTEQMILQQQQMNGTDKHYDNHSQSGGSLNTYKSIENSNKGMMILPPQNHPQQQNSGHQTHPYKNKYNNNIRNNIRNRRNITATYEDNRQSNKNRSFINKPANIAPPTFQIGDQVDGLCTLQNGSKRWYPGVIIAMNTTHTALTFSVQFNDGEISYTMTTATMRPRKNRRRKRGGGGSRAERSSFGGDSVDDNMSLMSSNDEISIISSLDHLSLTGSVSGIYHDFSDQIIDLYGEKPPVAHKLLATEIACNDKEEQQELLTNRSLGNSSIESVENKDLKNNNDIDEIIMDNPPHPINVLSASKPSSSSNKNRAFETPEKFSDTNNLQSSPDLLLSPSPFSTRAAQPYMDTSSHNILSVDPLQLREDNDNHIKDLSHLLSSTIPPQDDNISDSLSIHSLKSNGMMNDNQPLQDQQHHNNFNEDDSSCGSAEKDLIFEIPSIFDGVHRTNSLVNNSFKNTVVPRMRFDDIDMSSALPNNASNFSLSGALLNENTSRSFRQSSIITSHRSIADESINNSTTLQNHYGSSNRIKLEDTEYQQNNISRQNTGHYSIWHQGSFNDDQYSQYTYSDKNHPSNKILSKQYSHPDSSFPSYLIEKDPFHDWLYSTEDNNLYLQSILQTYCFISVILLKQCLTSNGLLDSTYCSSPGDIFSPVSLESSDYIPNAYGVSSGKTIGLENTNVLFHVREFLESSSFEFKDIFIKYIISLNDNNVLRLCKILNQCYFKNCLSKYLNQNGEKIGEGGFGSVFKVSIPSVQSSSQAIPSNDKHHLDKKDTNKDINTDDNKIILSEPSIDFYQYINCYHCYRKKYIDIIDKNTPDHSNNKRNTRNSNHNSIYNSSTTTINSVLCNCWKQIDDKTASDHNNKTFAIKRINRERSIHDMSLIHDLYNEITCLELLRHEIGICSLVDYGIVDSEYWLVMECGLLDLEEWRLNLTPNAKDSTKMPGIDTLSRIQIASCLLLYMDALLIVKSIHNTGIVHFDIKCNNFILRNKYPTNPKNMQEMHNFHTNGLSSGMLFLADFGEAIPHINENPVDNIYYKIKSRGTLFIQSPEMLCINESNYHTNTNTPTLSTSNYPSQSSDVWSLGCLLYELILGNALFADKPWTELYITLCKDNNYDPNIFELEKKLAKSLQSAHKEVLDSIVSLMKNTLQQDPEKRYPISKIINEVTVILETYFADCLSPTKVDQELDLYSNSHINRGQRLVELDNYLNNPCSISNKKFEYLNEQNSYLNDTILAVSDHVYITYTNQSISNVNMLIKEIVEPYHSRSSNITTQAMVVDPYPSNSNMIDQLKYIDDRIYDTQDSKEFLLNIDQQVIKQMQRYYQHSNCIYIITVAITTTMNNSNSNVVISTNNSMNTTNIIATTNYDTANKNKKHMKKTIEENNSNIKYIRVNIHKPTNCDHNKYDLTYILQQLQLILSESMQLSVDISTYISNLPQHQHTKGGTTTTTTTAPVVSSLSSSGHQLKALLSMTNQENVTDDLTSLIIPPLVIITIEDTSVDWNPKQEFPSTESVLIEPSINETRSHNCLTHMTPIDNNVLLNKSHLISHMQITLAIAIGIIVNANHNDMIINPTTVSEYLQKIKHIQPKSKHSNTYVTNTQKQSSIGNNAFHMISIDSIDNSLKDVMNICKVLPSIRDMICIEFIHSILHKMINK